MTADTPPQNVSSRRLLPLSAILAEFGLHKTTVYGLIKQNRFPRPIKVGGSSRWLADEIEAFKAERMASR
jgi:prophage regulatory protein